MNSGVGRKNKGATGEKADHGYKCFADGNVDPVGRGLNPDHKKISLKMEGQDPHP